MTWSFFFAIMLFAISLISVLVENLTLTTPFLSILPTLINSSSGPLSVICIIAIIATLWKYKDSKTSAVLPIVVYILDLAVINKLYLNATWPMLVKRFLAIFATMRTWNWPIIVITIFCLAVAAAMLVWGIHIWKKEASKKKVQVEQNAPEPISHSVRLKNNGESDSTHPPIETPATYAPTNVCTAPVNEGTEEPPSLAYGIVCILLIIPMVAFIQYVFYRILPLGLTVPKFVDDIFNILLYLSTICVALVMVLLLWIAKRQAISNGKTVPLRRPAVLALILEALIFILFIFNAGSINPQFLNSFLNTVTNNALAALVVVPIVLFVILDVGISLFLNVLFGSIGSETHGWQQEAHEKLVEIQRRIVIFVLNIFLGILSLFLFIPDFFNEIGSLLLSEDDLFPKFYRNKSSSIPSGAQEAMNPTQPSEEQETSSSTYHPEDQRTPEPVQSSEVKSPSKTD